MAETTTPATIGESWTVWTLDVWGNPSDGWDVNDRSNRGKINLAIDATDAQIIEALIWRGYLSNDARGAVVVADADDRGMNIDRKRDGRPILQMEKD